MMFRQLTESYTVSPQIAPGDVAQIAQAGFTRIICNRPDHEHGDENSSARISEACKNAGIEFVAIQFDMTSLTPEMIEAHGQACRSASGPVFAYCASGTRSSVAWCLTMADELGADTVLAAASSAGYDLSALRPKLSSSG